MSVVILLTICGCCYQFSTVRYSSVHVQYSEVGNFGYNPVIHLSINNFRMTLPNLENIMYYVYWLQVLYSGKFWWEKILVNLAISYEVAKVLSANCLKRLGTGLQFTKVFFAKYDLACQSILPPKFSTIQYIKL